MDPGRQRVPVKTMRPSTTISLLIRRVAKPILPVNTYRKLVAREFHRHYYRSLVWQDTYWFGVPVWKCPPDMWIYQELLHEVRPDLIVETGTQFGGSAYFLASMCDLLGRGHVISIDVEARAGRPEHRRLQYLLGSSTSPAIVEQVSAAADDAQTVLVILDSEHSCEHVLSEMRAYASLVTAGSYLIIEDTNINGHPILRGYGPGPMEAVDEFLRGGAPFSIDSSREKFGLSFSPRGFLRRAEDGSAPGAAIRATAARAAQPTSGT